MDDKLREAMNAAYAALDKRAKDILNALKASGLKRLLSYGYYAGHNWPDAAGGYQMDHYPIPVITVQDLCDIEIDFAHTSITAKQSKEAALRLDDSAFQGMRFAVYGLEDFQTDYKKAKESPDVLPERLKNSGETAFFYSFLFSGDVDKAQLLATVKRLEGLGFFY